MMRFIGFVLIGFCSFGAAVASERLSSPDGRVSVEFALGAEGAPRYRLLLADGEVLAESRLGVVLDDADFSTGLRLVEASGIEPVSDRYELASAKRRVNTYAANRRVYRLATEAGRRMDVEFQVSDDGAAFRYVFPEKSDGPRDVVSEATTFRFAPESRAWLQPMSVAKTGWARTNPSYEEYYQQEIAVGAPSTLGAGWVFPALFRTGDTWVLVSEAGLSRGDAAARLRHEAPGGEYGVGYADSRETMGGATVNPRFTTPHAMPWRLIVAGGLKAVVESTLGTDLAAPAAASAAKAKPGAASWSWPRLGDGKTVFAVQKRFIDYAADMGWRYCLIDAQWDKQISESELDELLRHARAKNVELLLWYNTNGDWNDAHQTPKHRLLTRESRAAEFARLQKLGVAGIKVDFFGGDGRPVIDLYLDLLEESAPYGLQLNFHGATLPRGWQRTYPHLMTVEAVRGYEFITFEQANADRAPAHMAMLPFARNVFDPMDFTPLCLDKMSRVRRRTMVAAELATAVLFTSGIQHYVEIPEGMAKQPDYVREHIKRIPTGWEESRFLAGYPGKLAIMARRGADGRWWIAGLNGEATAKTVEVDLAGLGATGVATLDVITDAAEGGFAKHALPVERGMLRVELAPNGGFSAVLNGP